MTNTVRLPSTYLMRGGERFSSFHVFASNIEYEKLGEEVDNIMNAYGENVLNSKQPFLQTERTLNAADRLRDHILAPIRDQARLETLSRMADADKNHTVEVDEETWKFLQKLSYWRDEDSNAWKERHSRLLAELRETSDAAAARNVNTFDPGPFWKGAAFMTYCITFALVIVAIIAFVKAHK